VVRSTFDTLVSILYILLVHKRVLSISSERKLGARMVRAIFSFMAPFWSCERGTIHLIGVLENLKVIVIMRIF
jgi:hypothetical protein